MAPASGLAQTYDEVIADPEVESRKGSSRDDVRDEVIADPEIASDHGAWEGSHAKEPAAPRGPVVDAEPAFDPLANTGIAMIEVVGQVQFDTRHEGGLEDAYETRLRLDSEVDFRRSRRLRMSLGVRTDLFWALPARGDPDLYLPATDDGPGRQQSVLAQDRFELDVLPLSAYVDVTVVDGLHLRMGEQMVSMSRMDFYSPIDMLAAHDLRGQPTQTAATPKLSQPAIRLDWDMGEWATLQVIYVPWFMPHLPRSNRDRYVANVLGSSEDALPAVFDAFIDPSYQTKAPEQVLRFIGPPPDFKTPQAQARLNLRGAGREIAVSAGTALEKFPSIYSTPLAERLALADDREPDPLPLANEQLLAGNPLMDVAYHRFYQFGIDGSFDIGPMVLNFEFTYSPGRRLYAARPGGNALPQPNTSGAIRDAEVAYEGKTLVVVEPGNVDDASIRRGVPMVQGALHLEWLHGTRFGIVGEAFWLNALELPYDLDRDWWAFIPGTGAFIGGLLAMIARFDEGRWQVNVAAVAAPGPSLIFLPQVELRTYEHLFVNVGATFYEGPAPTPHGGQDLNFGGLYSGYDMVFIGFRYNP
ncbi:MAG: hypothetical protein ABW252_00290 [Polyangiales bacterium]